MLETLHYYAIGGSPTGAEEFEVLRTPLAVTRKNLRSLPLFSSIFSTAVPRTRASGKDNKKSPRYCED